MKDETKNLILATALSFVVMVVWLIWFTPPPVPVDSNAPVAQSVDTPAPATLVPPTETPAAVQAARVVINTPRLTGSISMLGGRIDDLSLKDYRKTLDPTSPNVRLLSQTGGTEMNAEKPYYAVYGWLPAGGLDPKLVPDARTIWQAETSNDLAVETPVTMSWDNGAGLIFRRTVSVDENYMFTVAQSVENKGAAPVRLAPYGIIARHGEPKGQGYFVLHEGMVRVSDGNLGDETYKQMRGLDVNEKERAPADVVQVTDSGWIGFTDKNWMTVLVTKPGQPFDSIAKYTASTDVYQTEARLPTMDVAPGTTAEVETMLFAGAKEWETIRNYEAAGVAGFVNSIDWGWFYFLTKPIFQLLHWLHALLGNMGWAIVALTLVIKAILFPLARKSYISMARMKELQPEMEKLKERMGDDRQKMQQEVMQLYKREKVNPAAGCLPILLQIPIFFSLYKVILVTIELRQAPWIGWIRDLSAPDPSSILNLFGLLPYATPETGSIFFIFSLGLLPILLGISMWLQQKLNPAPTDPTQQMIFAWMPWVFMFMLGRFASGLVLYWITNNTITFIQQYTIMSMHGKRPDLFGNILQGFRRKVSGEPEVKETPAPVKAVAKPAAKPAAKPTPPKPKATPRKGKPK